MRSYRSLAAWQVSHQLAQGVLRATDRHWHPRARAAFDQLRRAAISVPANVVEGYALNTPGLLKRHLRIALGSVTEADYLLELCDSCQYLPATDVGVLRKLADRSTGLLYGLYRRT